MRKVSQLAVLFTVLLFLGSISFLADSFAIEEEVFLTPSREHSDHLPITINGNSDLSSRAVSEGWSGTGSSSDPYIIKGYKIIATGNYGISISNIDLYLIIDDCNITNSDQANVLVSNSENIVIKNCILYFNAIDAIRLSGSSNCVVENNTMDAEEVITIGRNGITLVDSTENTIKNNKIARMVNEGIWLRGSSSGNNIIDNDIEQANNNAISVESDSNIFKRNSALNSGKGIKVNGDLNLISENSLRKNGYGVYLTEGRSNVVEKNIITRNFIGINVVISTRNEIIDNYIGKSASYGIDLYTNTGSANIIHSNHLYYNNLTDGSYDQQRIQARDLNPGNIWYNDSIDRGNFWFDWRGNDNDDDGIVDLSYPVDGEGARDIYPFLNPLLPDAFIPPWGLRPSPQPTYIDLDWYAPFYGPEVSVVAYDLYRSERGGGELYLASIPGSQTTYRDLDVISGRAYWYYVVALNDITFSNQSSRIKSSPDTLKPNIKIDSPEDGDIFDTTSIRVTYTGTDNIAIDRFEISLDGGENIDKGLWENITFIGLSEGDHTVNVTVFDLAEHSRTATSTFTIDITDPYIRIDAPDDKILLFNTISPTIYWEGHDDVTYITGFYVSLDRAPYSLVGGLTQLKLNELSVGEHTISIMAIDGAGNEINDTVNMTIDPNEPGLSIIEPVNYFVNNTGNLNIRWYGDDPISGLEKYLIRWGHEDWKDNGLDTSYNISGLREGTHHIYIRAIDRAGNNRTEERTVIVDLSPPEMNIVFPEEGGRYSEEFNIEWEASDILTGIKGVTLILDEEDERFFRPDELITLGFGKDGYHEFDLLISDGAGNTVKMTRSFFFDVSQPTVDSIVPPTKNDIPVDTTIQIGFSEIVDQDSIEIDISDIEGNYSWKGNNLTFTPTDLLEQNTKYTLRVTGRDIAGNILVPFDWYFITEIDLSLGFGLITGRVIDTAGSPISNATIWSNTGEKTVTGSNGLFVFMIPEDATFLKVSIDGFIETRFNIDVVGGSEKDIGDLPIRPITENIDKNDEGNNTWLIILVVFVVVAVLFGILIGWQVKKTRDYSKMPAIPDEWVNGQPARDPETKMDSSDLRSLSRLNE